MALQEYRCPCCGGSIEFNSTVGKMKCPYCDSEFEMDSLKDIDQALDSEEPESMKWADYEGQSWGGEDMEGMASYHCKSCGAEIITAETTGASSCPYCGNPIVMMQAFAGTLKPEFIIPFKLDKEAAKVALTKHFQGKKLLPSAFSSQNHIDEVNGVYVPFWLFNSGASANIRYKATKVERWSDNDYNYKETKYYTVVRDGSLFFENIPVDGSKKMDDDLMDSLEPFDFKEEKEFMTAYLSGYLADKYDVSAEESVERANLRIKNSTIAKFRSTVKDYDTVETENANIQLHDGSYKYGLLPMWILNTSWNGQKFVFGMNGQTGKFVGNLPMDKGKFWKYFFIYFIISFAVTFLIAFLLLKE